MKIRVTALLIGAVASGLCPISIAPARAIPVFDATNYAQNLIQAARALQQVNNQIRSLQNEAAMLASMARHLSRIDFAEMSELQQTFQRIDTLMTRAQAIGFEVDRLDERFDQLFPEALDATRRTDARIAEARARMDASQAAFRHAMTVQAQIVENVHDDATVLGAIVARSQGAEGSLQAAQATNQLLALAAKQQFQLQQLMAAQFRSEAADAARRAQEADEARAATRRFLGTGRAYTPR